MEETPLPEVHDGSTEGDETPSTYPPSPPWSEGAKLLVVGMLFLLAILGVFLVRNVIAIAAFAGLIAFLIAPLIRLAVHRFRLPRGIALLLAYLVVFAGTLMFGALLAQSIIASIGELDPIGLLNDARVWLVAEADQGGRVILFGMTVDISAFLAALESPAGQVEGQGGVVIDGERLLGYLGTGLTGFRTVAGVVTAVVASAIVTTLVAMYLNADSKRLHVGAIAHIPPGYERDGLMMMMKQKRVWRGYLYGQLVNSLITGLFVFVVLWIVGVPGAFLMGTIMMVLNMIPTFGPILAAIPGVLAALISGSTRWPELEHYWFALIVVGIYLVVVQAQANIIAPKVMGTAVQLRPAVVLVGLIAGFHVGGLLGSLLAVPIIASLRDIVAYLWRKLIDADPWPGEDPVPVNREL